MDDIRVIICNNFNLINILNNLPIQSQFLNRYDIILETMDNWIFKANK
jgi:hypothetical protein